MTNIIGPALSWRLVHDGMSILSMEETAGYTESAHQIFEAPTELACYNEAIRLGLILGIVVPEVITMRQARMALFKVGLLAMVNGLIAGMPGEAGDAARIEWEFSSTVERHRGLVSQLGAALGLTESQVDILFFQASFM